MRGRPRKIISIAWNDARRTFRDKEAVFWQLLFPLFMLLFFGFLFSGPTQTKIGIGVINEDKGYMDVCLGDIYVDILSNETKMPFEVSTYSSIDAGINDMKSFPPKIYIIIVIPENFTETIFYGTDNVTIKLIYDKNNPNLEAYASFIVSFTYEFVHYARNQTVNVTIVSESYVARKYNTGQFATPGILCATLLFSATSTTSFILSEEKEKGMLRRILLAPVKPSDVLMGKALGSIIVALPFAFVIYFISMLVFGYGPVITPITLLVMVLAVLFSSMVGLIISCLMKSAKAASGATIAMYQMMLMFSGAYMPLELFPETFKMIAYTIPFTYFVYALKASMLQELVYELFTYHLLIAIIETIILFFIAVIIYNRTIRKIIEK